MSSVVESTGPVKFALISANNGGGNELVAAVEGKCIRLLSYVLVAAGTVNMKFQSATTDLTGAMPLVANLVVPAGFEPTGHVQTAGGEALNMSLSAGVLVAGHLKYQEVDPE